MRTIILLISKLVLICSFAWGQQQIQLYSEDFESSPIDLALNVDTVGFSSASGVNQWIINDEYDGQPLYPVTTRQDSTVSGTIGNAPFSNYLHIHDSSATGQGIANANFDPTSASDHFAYISDEFCSLGLIDVKFTFFYVAGGGPDAYGEVYYSRDNGPWQKVGKTKYNNQSKWKYEVISDSSFNKATSLRFGFRWVNNSQTPQDTSISFGIDDVIAVGTYDDVNNPVDVQVDNIFPDTVCPAENLIISYSLTEPLCEANYRIQLSNSNGNFSNPTDLGFFPIQSTDTSSAISAEIPSGTPTGGCYKVRLQRVSPPSFIGSASACFTVEDCPNTINTMEPVAVTGPDTICALSTIDVPFTSEGGFNSGNVYTAQLMTDSSGSLTTPVAIDTIGTLQSADNFPPPQGGAVSGLVPDVPEGCDYYIRITSSDPAGNGSIYGPFCIKRCNVFTNEAQSLSVCVTDTSGAKDTISYETDFWGDSTDYIPGNSFEVQLLSKQSFAILSTGELGAVVDTADSTIVITIPNANNLGSAGIPQPGPYYLRVIADSATNQNDTLGTLINLTIGAPSSTPPEITADTVACNTDIVDFLVSPYNSDSDYQWSSNGINGGNPFIWPDNPLPVDFSGANPDDYTFIVREINNGCEGPFSDPHQIDVTTSPLVNINGPSKVCTGDTVNFDVPFTRSTYYGWSTSWGQIIDTSNNELTVVYDSVGQADIEVDALNECGSRTGNMSLAIKQLVDVDAGKDTTICQGAEAQLNAQSNGFSKTLTTGFTSSLGSEGAMFDIRALEDVTITSLDGNFLSDTVALAIYYREGTHIGNEQDSTQWTLLGQDTINSPNPAGNPTPIPIQINKELAAGDTLGFYITTTNNTFLSYTNGLGQGQVNSTDSIIDVVEGTENSYPFSNFSGGDMWDGNIHYQTLAGLEYEWSTGDTTPATTVAPLSSSYYTVALRDTSGCGTDDTVQVSLDKRPQIQASSDTSACLGDTIQLGASGADSYQWDNRPNLFNGDSARAIAVITTDTFFTVRGTDNARGCTKVDSIRVEPIDRTLADDTVTLCKGGVQQLALPENQNASYQWDDGVSTRTRDVKEPGSYVATVSFPDRKCSSIYRFYVAEKPCNTQIQVPQAFSPNGDGVNDYFSIFANGLQEYEINIFNRWGERVYHSTNLNELNSKSRGWDGTYKGEKQNTGTYVYYIEAKDFEGNSISKKGNVTLVR